MDRTPHKIISLNLICQSNSRKLAPHWGDRNSNHKNAQHQKWTILTSKTIWNKKWQPSNNMFYCWSHHVIIMCFRKIHHHTVEHNTAGQVFELLSSVEQINQLQRGWWIQHAVIVTCISHISKRHPSNRQDAHTHIYTHMAGLLSWRVKRPLTSTELHFLCSSHQSPKRETLSWQQPSSLSFNHPPPPVNVLLPHFFLTAFPPPLTLASPSDQPTSFHSSEEREVSYDLPQL